MQKKRGKLGVLQSNCNNFIWMEIFMNSFYALIKFCEIRPDTFFDSFNTFIHVYCHFDNEQVFVH